MISKIIRAVFFGFVLWAELSVQAQLIVTPNADAQYLVQDVLLGSGVIAYNFSSTGSQQMLGTFGTGANPTNLGVTAGVIMASGAVTNAEGPNSSGSTGSLLGLPGDPLLNTLVPGYTTKDACVLEFDFIPQGDTIQFRYVFASEEYPEWVGSSFNDVFGFFVSGLDPITYTTMINKNIAIIPGTLNIPVAINTVNQNPPYSMYYVSNGGGMTIEYDGFTTVLTAWCNVVPCTEYHIKLAIADAGDDAYDSGVFLEAGSFSSGGIQTTISFSNPDMSSSIAVEGCNDAIMTFKLAQPSLTGYMIPYSILFNSTATYGIDYDSIPSPLMIPIGGDSVSIIIHPFLDSIPEGNEIVGLIVPTNICFTDFDTIYFTIMDYEPLYVNAGSDTTILCGDTILLTSTHTGGAEPFFYSWSNGEELDSTLVYPSQATYYIAFVSDICGYMAKDSVLVDVFGPVAEAGNDTAICYGSSAQLTATGGSSYLWNTGETSASIQLTPLVTTTYLVTVTHVCSDIDSVTVTVNPLPPVSISASADSVCPGHSTQLTASGAKIYLWTSIPPDPSLDGQADLANPTVSPLVGTLYTVMGTDDNTCTMSASKAISIKAVPTSDFLIDKSILCQGEPTWVTYQGSATPQAVFNWNFDGAYLNGSGIGPYVATWLDAGTHVVSLIIDQNGCISPLSTDSVRVIPIPKAEFSQDQTGSCPPLAVNFTNLSQNTVSGATYQWYFGDGGNTYVESPINTYTGSGLYAVTLVVSNPNGCRDSITKAGLIHVYPVPEANFVYTPERVSIFDPVIKFLDRSNGNPISWVWDFDDGSGAHTQNTLHSFPDTGQYAVTLSVVNIFSCADTLIQFVEVYPDNTIYFPSAFTPNNDFVNDDFRVYGTNISDYHVSIFSRWGEEVYTSDSFDEGWDGTYKGQIAPGGVYIIIAYYRDADGSRRSYYGKISLIR